MCGPMEVLPKLAPAPGNQTLDLMIETTTTDNTKFFSDNVKNNSEKGENGGCQHFLLFQDKAIRSGPAMAGPNFWPKMKNVLLGWFSSFSKLREREFAAEKV